jgi:glycosyltransferase involved in cell wall biosynthesis
LSTYPPTQCGLATFTAALSAHMGADQRGGRVGIVRCVEALPNDSPPEVVHHLVAGSSASHREAVEVLNDFDVALIQHEFGIYGGPDGEELLSVLDNLDVPAIVVLHTVLVNPTEHQRCVLEAVLEAAEAIVVMTRTARRRLLDGYDVDAFKVQVIPHGAPVNNRRKVKSEEARPVILTWGLLGPGKGIEWGINAVAALRHLEPRPRYRVVGQTHPRVRERFGEQYRSALMEQAASLGIADMVEFDQQYRDIRALQDVITEADIVLLPYDSTDQVTSGVLIEAIAAGKPVVATRFPHAIELLGGGAGLLVAQGDAAAMARALERLITEPSFARTTAAHAERLAPELGWPAVGERYRQLAEGLVEARASAVA